MTTPEIIRYINTGQFDATRAASFDLTRAKGTLKASFVPQRNVVVDEENRTIEFSFASGDAVEHYFGYTVLDLSKDAADLERVTQGVCPFLVNHNRDDQIGVVMNCEADGNVIRGKVKFSRSARGEEMFQDVKDGIRNGTSIGFLVEDMILTEQKEGEIPTYTITKWTMLENSLASIPADISVGARRQLETRDDAEDMCPECDEPMAECTCEADTSSSRALNRAISTNTEKTMAKENETPETPVVERTAAQIARQEITEWADTLGGDDAVATRNYLRECVVGGTDPTIEGFRAALKAAQPPTVKVPAMDPQTTAQRQGQPVQLARTVSRVQLKAFKGQDAELRAYRSGMHLAAVLLGDGHARTYCQENGIALTRTQTGTDNTKGGFTVLPEFEQTIFELLLQYGVARRVCDVVPMASDTKIVTRRTGGLTAYPVGPGSRGTYSTMTDDQFELVARKWMVLSKREEELTEDSFINWADRLATESAYAFSFSEDDCLFNADGTSTYHGIVGITNKILGLSATRANIASAVVASGNAWSEIVIGDLLAVVGKLPSFARTSGNVRWYCTSEFWATVLQRLALAGGGVTHAEFEGELKPSFLGKPVELVEAMQHSEANDTIPLLYGNIAQAATFGDRRGITVKMTDSNDTDFESDLEATKATERFDINVHDVGNQSATAASRRPGPVVALLTAAS